MNVEITREVWGFGRSEAEAIDELKKKLHEREEDNYNVDVDMK